MSSRALRRSFLKGLFFGLRVVWPVLSGIVAAIVVLGLAVGWIEGWPAKDSLYFAFVTGLTIGYGDLAPKEFAARVLAIIIGGCGILLTGLVAAGAVKALTAVKGVDGKDGL
jgi:CBS domain containing-hemolysin-like protein